MVLRWDRPEKILTTQEWKGITADGAPPGVYTPNMSKEDMLDWKAKLIGGKNPRVEIRKTVIGAWREDPKAFQGRTRDTAQVLLIVTADRVRMSMNGTADFSDIEWEQLPAAVAEAKEVLNAKSKGDGHADGGWRGTL